MNPPPAAAIAHPTVWEQGHSAPFLTQKFALQYIPEKIAGPSGPFYEYRTFDRDGNPCRLRRRYVIGGGSEWVDGPEAIPSIYPAWRLTEPFRGAIWIVGGEFEVWACHQEAVTAACFLDPYDEPRLIDALSHLERAGGVESVRLFLPNTTDGRLQTLAWIQAHRKYRSKLDLIAYKWDERFNQGATVRDIWFNAREYLDAGSDESFFDVLDAQALRVTELDEERWARIKGGGKPPAFPSEIVEEPEVTRPMPRPDKFTYIEQVKRSVEVKLLPEPESFVAPPVRPRRPLTAAFPSEVVDDGPPEKKRRGRPPVGSAKAKVEENYRQEERQHYQDLRAGKATGELEAITTSPQQATFLYQRMKDLELLRGPSGSAFMVIERLYQGRPIKYAIEVDDDPRGEFAYYIEQLSRAHEVDAGQKVWIKKEAKSMVATRLQSESKERGTYSKFPIRVGGLRDEIYIDLGDESRRVVRIDTDGWEIVDDAPFYFRRSPSMQPLPEPVHIRNEEHRAAVWATLKRLLAAGSDDNFMRFVAFVMAALQEDEDTEYPGICVHGVENAGKTTRSRMIRMTIDPNEVDLAAEASVKEMRDFRSVLDAGHVLGIENLSTLAPEISDAICQVCTSGKFAARRLYTGKGLEVVHARCPVILNGISDFIKRADLRRRMVFIELPIPLKENTDVTPGDLLREYRAALPEILGAFYDAVSVALAHRRDPDITSMTWGGGMVTFGRWVEAAARELRGLPWSGDEDAHGKWHSLYTTGIKSAAAAASSQSIFILAFSDMADFYRAKDQHSVRMTASDVMNQIKFYATMRLVDRMELAQVIKSNTMVQSELGLFQGSSIDDVEQAISGRPTYTIWWHLPEVTRERLLRESSRAVSMDGRMPKMVSGFTEKMTRETSFLGIRGITFMANPDDGGSTFTFFFSDTEDQSIPYP